MEGIMGAVRAPFEAAILGALGKLDEVTAVASPLAEQSAVFRSRWLEAEADKLGAGIGLDALTTRYILVLFAAYPLSMVMRSLPASVKHLWSLVWGVFFAQFVFAGGWSHALVSSSVVYLIHLLPLPSKHVLTFVFMMGYMTVSHIYRMYTDWMGWSLDFTGPQMLLTIKLTSLAYNYYDGATNGKATRADADGSSGASGGKQRLAQRRLASAVDSWPNPLAYFAYVFDYGTFFAGPAMEYHDYDAGVYGTYLPAGESPSSVLPALARLASGVLFLGLTQFGKVNFPMEQLYDPEFVAANPLPVRFGTALVCLFFVRCKYYFAWKISEGGVVMAGFGYNRKTAAWDAVGNVDILAFEYPSNLDSASRAWNKATQKWLASCVYTRTPRSVSMLATYSLSAFWHGFYPGYYLFFLSVIPAQSLGKLVNARVRPSMFKDADQKEPKAIKFLYDHLGSILSHFSLNYLASVFVVLSWQRGLALWTSWYFLGHICFFGGRFIVLALYPKKRKDSKKKGE